jgi:hypothetical protein
MDITQRLRSWSFAPTTSPASDLMDEAANEIDRLRLTDAEREAMEYFSLWVGWGAAKSHAVTLRGLLDRTE